MALVRALPYPPGVSNIRIVVFLIAAGTLAACSGTKTSIPLSWRNPTFGESTFKKLFVIGVGEDEGARRLFEDTFAKALANEGPGDQFRYSSSLTMLLVLMVENIAQMPWQAFWNERVWSKIGPRHPFIVGLAPDGTPGAAGMNITTPEDMLRYALLYTPSWPVVAKEQVISDKLLQRIQTLGDPKAYHRSAEEAYGTRWFGETPERNTAQWDHAFPDGAMFKHGNMGQGIYVDPARDFCGMYFGLATNDEAISGADHSPGYLRTAAKQLAGR